MSKRNRTGPVCHREACKEERLRFYTDWNALPMGPAPPDALRPRPRAHAGQRARRTQRGRPRAAEVPDVRAGRATRAVGAGQTVAGDDLMEHISTILQRVMRRIRKAT
jgi:hypothetical protein